MDDFLYALKVMLLQNLTSDQVDEQVSVYEDYINEQMAGGKTLDQVMRQLGDPSVIADKIIEQYREGYTPNQKEEKETQSDAEMREVLGLREELHRRMGMTAEEINGEIHNPEHGIQAKFKENEGWDVRLGKLKLNSWYGTLIILGIVLVIFILIHELTGL